uniref:Chromodomain-helicase-DNA-binding protein 7 n=1 Tax=Chrysemys picta bellii TaxID=8478 RepID=A0A8C3IFF9_CHRPI
MADPGMMSLFGEDGNIFSEGLESLGECGYPENTVNPMGQQMPIDQGFPSLQSSLHHPPTNQNQAKLTHFDHYNQYEQQKIHLMDQPNRMMGNAPGNGIASPHSQYHNPPVPQQQPTQPSQTPSGPPGQGHSQHMQQMGNYMARGDFSMQQHGQPQQQRMNQFSQGQEGLNQGNPFIATSGPGHLSHVPQQNPSMAPSLRHSVQQFHHHPPTALHGESVAHSPRFSPNPPQQGAVRPQTLNFSSRSQTVPSPTINNSGQYSRYPYSNLNQGLVNNTGMNQNLGLTNNTPMNQSVPRYTNAVGFPSNSGQGLMHQQPIHPSGSLNQMNTQTMHPSQPQGTYASPPPMSPMKAMSNPAGTPPPQVRPGSAGIPMEVGSYPNIPHPQPSHQPPGKRRSSRQVKRKRYTEDLEFKISDEEKGIDPGKQIGVCSGNIWAGIALKKFFFLLSSSSYLHCQWASVEQLDKDKRIQQKVKRFKAKQGQNKFLSEIDDELFNPDYVEVDRIMDFSHSTDDNGEPVTHYLVKWCSLPYEDSTWELKQDIDQAKIEEFEKLMSREILFENINWLLFNWYNTRNCILADEMGLGKTIQSITFLYEIYLKGIHGPFLVIAPLSTIPNWEREFRTWTELNVVVYHGSQASRRTIQLYEMYFKDPQGRVIKGSYKFHAIITTFEMILTDCPELRNIPWRCVVIDEAHRLKNRNCKLLEGLKMMDLEHKVLLTGTPLQNTVEELFSLLHFLEPGRFPSESTFMQEFGDLKTEEQVQKLQAILKPMMLRRLKEDVEKNLAPKEETIIEVELTNIQKKYYRAILEKNFTFLSKGGGQANVPNLLNTMMELRKCCNHPYLINGAEEKILEEFKETHNADSPDFQLQAMIQAAGKLVLIDKLLPKLKAGGHRVLIFSQMVRCLDILEDYLIQRRYPYERIDGRVRGNLRQAAIDRFSRPDSDRFVFLLCTRAGGLGINLTAADTCIIFDSDWNPQNDLQAQARCHRIGQSKSVKIYRLITRNSYEREMFDKASLKLGLDKAVLQSMSGRENVQQLSKKEIEDLLRKGAYGALMDEEDEGSKFCEEDIDQILLRRTHTITIESEGKGSTFAKASFVASGNRTDISLDDPNFWQKWAKKAELDIDALNGRNNLVIDTPRVRKQTRLYSAVKEDELMEFSDLESDSEEKPCTKPRRPQDKSQGYARSECFRVEKNLLVYGWGRWTDILSHGRYKRPLTEQDVETICRTILVYCLNHYKGDENIKSFIWDLITPTADGQTRALVNHSGLSAPVPRGRKGKKVKAQSSQPVLQDADWLASCNPDVLFQEDSYKKHLKHHCNKVLLRVRMLYYLRQEVIGDQADKILEGADSSEVDVWIPEPFHAEVPTDWWDKEADKSLLIGVFKHGYEKYNSMRADPALCFLERVGMPDAKAIAAEQRGTDMLADGGQLYWPTTSTLTTRLRRLITAYQRSYKRQQMRQEALMKTDRRRRRPREEVRALEAEREAIITEKRQKWTRREEADFYRVVSTFGVIFDPMKQQFDWNQFRAFARLDKKSDESLEKYFNCFVTMCRRVCRMPAKPDEEPPDLSTMIEPITEERASRTLYRIELLRKIREQVLHHPQLGERLKLCQPSLDLPEWWECGKHDKDLLIGAAKHGVSRTDYHILNDPELSFLDAHRNFAQNRGAGNASSVSSLNPLGAGCSHTPPIVPSTPVQDDKATEQTESKVEGSENSAAKEKSDIKEETDIAEKGIKQECDAEAELGPVKCERKAIEMSTDVDPKSISEKGSEEDEEEKLDDDDKSEESSQPEGNGKNFDEESNASMSTARDETRDGFYLEDGDPSVAQLLHERTFAFSFWPKDRVMINRLDNICEAVLKGKWPVNRRQMFDFQGLIPGYTPTAVDSPLQKRSFAELSMVGQASISGSEDITASPQLSKKKEPHFASGLSRTPTRHLLNGSLMDGEPPMKRRRGRRKNVEGLDLLFMSNKRTSLTVVREQSRNIPSPGQLDPDTRIPVINLEDGTRLVGEDAPKNKDLIEWLKSHPTYTVDIADVLFSPFQKPKQKRHRCRNPNKLDINTLTGEERVPVVNKRNGKKMGGAMAPPMKDLPRWLEENPEFAVAPDWTDIVKQSGFVPESMFDRLLTGPVVREEGASRRGRRPKSEIAKAAAAAAAVASTSGINPLLMNSLFAGMDLTSLQNLQNLQSLQLAGLMGFPPGLATAAAAGGDSKNPAAMLPLMLPGMAGLPNMFGLGGLLNNPITAAPGNTTPASSQGETEDGTSKAEEKKNENEEENKDSEKSTDVSATDSANGSVSAATAAAATSNNTGLPTNPLAFNPFLLSTMAPGLFYPSMFLPPGLGGLTLPGFPGLAGLQNAVGSNEEKATDKTEGAAFKEEENLEGSDAEESLDKTADSSVLEDEIAQGEELDSLDGGDEIENNENDE